jgi:hypothetical protein
MSVVHLDQACLIPDAEHAAWMSGNASGWLRLEDLRTVRRLTSPVQVSQVMEWPARSPIRAIPMGGSAAFRDVAGWCAGVLTTTLPRTDTPSF